LLKSGNRCVTLCDDNFCPEIDQLGSKDWEPIGFSLGPAIINEDIPALDIAEFAEPLPECFKERGASGRGESTQVTYARDFL
jgi:hypothetical protein